MEFINSTRRRHAGNTRWLLTAASALAIAASGALSARAQQQAGTPAAGVSAPAVPFQPAPLRGTAGSLGDLTAPAGGNFGMPATPPDYSVSGSQADPTPGAANYGKPLQRKTFQAKPVPKRGRPVLPALQPYGTSAVARRQAGDPALSDPKLGNTDPPPSVAVLPTIPQRKRAPVDDRPFDPVGIGIGTLRLTPYVENSLGYDTNPNRQSGGSKGSAYYRGEVGAGVQSEWSRHELRATLRGGYSEYFSLQDASRPDGAGTVNGRLDITRDTAIDAEGRFVVDSQRPGSSGLLAGVTVDKRPLTYSYGTSLGITQRFGRVSLLLRGSVDRYTYDDATQSDGTLLALSAQDYNAYGLRARAGYDITPGITPFVEGVVDTRRYDQRVDATGFERDSSGLAARLGSSFEITRLLTGEISGGYAKRNYQDPRLQNLSGPTLDASLVWQASALTRVTLRSTTALAETTVSGSSGADVNAVSLEIAHKLLPRLTLTGLASFQNAAYQGVALREKTYSGALRADYNLSREIMLRASVSREQFQSNAANANYVSNVFLLGVRLQR